MPRGQTIVHFPHSMQFFIILKESASFPLWRQRSTFLTLIPEKEAAGQVALHEPQAMQRAASGSMRQSSSKRALSTVSKLTVELGEILNPNIFIFRCRLSVNVSQGLLILLLPMFPVPSWDLCMHLHRRYPSSEMKLSGIHCHCFAGNRLSR